MRNTAGSGLDRVPGAERPAPGKPGHRAGLLPPPATHHPAPTVAALFTCTDLLAVGAEGSLSALGASLGFSITLGSL